MLMINKNKLISSNNAHLFEVGYQQRPGQCLGNALPAGAPSWEGSSGANEKHNAGVGYKDFFEDPPECQTTSALVKTKAETIIE